MKKKIIWFLLPLISLGLFQSCGDDVSLEDQENYIEYRIYSDTPDSQLYVDATGIDGYGVYVRNSFEKALTTKDFFAVIKVKCDDPKALISVELYVNKKLRVKTENNSYVFVSERLKGTGPYLY